MAKEAKSGSKLDVIYIALLVILLVVAIFYIGKPRVGIINLARVAEELGVGEQIVEDAKRWRAEASDDFERLKEAYQAFGKGIQARVAEAESEAEKRALRQSLADATREYYSSSAEVRKRMRQRQQDVLRSFRERVNPYVREVSRKRRLWLVLDQSTRLVYATERIDITDDVIEKARPFFESQTNLLDEADLSGELAPEPEPEPGTEMMGE